MQAWVFGDTATAQAALDRYIDWTPATAAALQESVLGGDLITVCGTTETVSYAVVVNNTNGIIIILYYAYVFPGFFIHQARTTSSGEVSIRGT